MWKRKAFTLVELLVVIAIIALLIAILAPSLRNARLVAKQMMCGQNLRAIGNAIQTYAAANRNFVPPFANSQEEGKRDEALDPSFPGELAVAYRRGVVDTYGENAPYNLAFLYNEYSSTNEPQTLYVDDWHIFYCPSQPRTKELEADFRKKGFGFFEGFYDPYLDAGVRWKEATYAWPDGVCTSYTYNPNITVDCKLRYAKIDQFPAESVLAMDIVLSSADFVAHWISAPSWNVCFADSHVENILSPPAEALFETGVGEVSHDAAAFLDFMNVIVYGAK